MRPRDGMIGFALVALGVLIGGTLFSRSIPRSVIALPDCGSTCYRPQDLAGLVASVGIRMLPGWVPGIVAETDRCLALRHPQPEARVHLVLVPKHDARDIGELTVDDQPFVMDCFAMVAALATTFDARNYRLVTNGPALQHVTYLHFHLIAR